MLKDHLTAISTTVLAVAAVVTITATTIEYVAARERDLNERITDVESELRTVKDAVDRNTAAIEEFNKHAGVLEEIRRLLEEQTKK